ncbi:MAG: DUF1566 domain-containing protein [Saprospiraceae bacterium]|nr:DUF1566 domain-containing protein [Saprospiraceae bacterium]
MKKHLFVLIVFMFPVFIFSQNVGIGNNTPLMKLHITKTDSSVLLLENTVPLGIGVNTSMYFKNGNGSYPYTGGIKTIGTGSIYARLGFFTYASTSPNGLLERMSILDGGNVGIGLTSPSAKLEVEGGIKADSLDLQSGLIKNVADPIFAQDAATKAYVDLLENTINDLESKVALLITVLNLSVQQRLDLGETPIEIYNSDNSLLDSLYGKTYQEGLITYLNTSTGAGLVAAPSDQSIGAEWGCYGDNIGGTNNGIGTGQANTTLIVDGCAESGIAAKLCDDLVIGMYDDWFLPSKDELNEMYINLEANGFGGFSSTFYWSSTEYSNNWAWWQSFSNGNQAYYFKYENIGNIRAVRAF